MCVFWLHVCNLMSTRRSHNFSWFITHSWHQQLVRWEPSITEFDPIFFVLDVLYYSNFQRLSYEPHIPTGRPKEKFCLLKLNLASCHPAVVSYSRPLFPSLIFLMFLCSNCHHSAGLADIAWSTQRCNFIYPWWIQTKRTFGEGIVFELISA